MLEFLKQSQTFEGLTFQGSYSMPLSHFSKLYQYWKETNINLLDTYTDFVDNLWHNSGEIGYTMTHDEHLKLTLSFDLLIQVIDIEQQKIDMVFSHIDKKLQNYEKTISNKRLIASMHTSNHSVRKRVFNKYGKACLCCGSDKSIEIDHVVPVALGGENDISNYQPLCRSCNAKKGATIIDYRKSNNNG